jgi:hypothetical protein
MPTEELRDRIDGPDIVPERRQFARVIELFECELRAPAPGVTWEALTRGAGVPPSIMGGLPSLAERMVRRTYDEYCEPARDFQPLWDADTENIARLRDKLARQKAHEFIAKVFAGVSVGLGGQALYVASLLCGPITPLVFAVYIFTCLLSLAYLLRVRHQRIALRG